MKEFLIDFNRENNDEVIKQIATGKIHTLSGEFVGYSIQIGCLDDLGALEKKVKEITGKYYSLIVSVCDLDGNTIYLDDNI